MDGIRVWYLLHFNQKFIRYFSMLSLAFYFLFFNFTAKCAVVLSESVGILACGLARSLRITVLICLFIQYLSYDIYLGKETFSCSASRQSTISRLFFFVK